MSRDSSNSRSSAVHPVNTDEVNPITDPAKKEKDDSVTIAFQNISSYVRVSENSDSYMTFFTPFVTAAKIVTSRGKSWKPNRFYRLSEVSGVIGQGMTLVVAAPGHGKTSYLRLVSQTMPYQAGEMRFNGYTAAEAAADGIDVRKLTSYCEQVENHLPLLTVAETIRFAHRMTSSRFEEARVQQVIDMLGLRECADTIVGDGLVRGISGGQKRRVTIAEALAGDAKVVALDEFSNGLDSATSLDIAKGLKQWCTQVGGTVVATLQQPSPDLFAMFDNVVVLREGQVVFHGPRAAVLPYFASIGFPCPADVDVCDFLIDVLSQPRLTLERLRALPSPAAVKGVADKIDNATAAIAATPVITDAPTAVVVPSPTAASIVTPPLAPSEVANPVPTMDCFPPVAPCVTVEAMVHQYKQSCLWRRMYAQLQCAMGTADTAAESDTTAGIPLAELAPAPTLCRRPLAATAEDKAKYATGTTVALSTVFATVLARQMSLLRRDTMQTIPRLINVIVMGLIYGSLYYGLDSEQYIERVAIIVMGMSQLGFGNMVELPVAVAQQKVASKHIANRYFPAWVYVACGAIASIPMFLAEVLVFSNILYWLVDHVREPAEYFTYLALAFVQAFNMSVWFRLLSGLFSSEELAQTISGPSVGFFMTLGNFFVTFNSVSIPIVSWLIYVFPFSWTVRAMANNEFLSTRYDAVSNGQRIGHFYLKALDMFIGYEWIGYAVLYVMFFSFLILCAHTYVIDCPYFEPVRGTARITATEEPEEELELPVAQDVDEDVSAERELSRASAVGEGGIASLARTYSSLPVLQTMRDALPFTPVWLSFDKLTYTVQVEKDGATLDRPLLRNVSGYAEPGTMTALMGASGAGKTTLLDVLANRKTAGTVEGDIRFNGRPATAKDFTAAGYVEQFDSLWNFDTVQETLMFAASTRLPASVPQEVKARVVEEVMQVLELTSIAHRIIGNSILGGLSPSQLKLVNIGVELCANPAVIFLDEPTTGLDSRAAQTVMRAVRRIARAGRTVICTIHQPSSELFYLFDRLVLLNTGGYQMYCGDLGPRAACLVRYLQCIPGVAPLPHRTNPASWMLDQMGVGVAATKATTTESGAVAETPQQMTLRFSQHYASSCPARRVERVLQALHSHQDHIDEPSCVRSGGDNALPTLSRQKTTDSVGFAATIAAAGAVATASAPTCSTASHGALPSAAPADVDAALLARASLWMQWRLLQTRSLASYWRNPPLLLPRLLMLLFLSVFMGLLYIDTQLTSQADLISAISSRAFFIIFGSLLHGAATLPIFMNARPVLYRERASNMYAPALWAIANVLTEVVWVAAGATIVLIPGYFLIGMTADAGVFFQTLLTTYTLCLTFVCMSLLIASIAPSISLAGVIQGMYFSLYFTFAGIGISVDNVPRGWLWVFRMLPLSHITEMLVMPQFSQGSLVLNIQMGLYSTTMTVREYVSYYLGFGYDGYWSNWGWVLLYMAVVLTMAITFTHFLVFNNR